jgi:hypothetical protein
VEGAAVVVCAAGPFQAFAPAAFDAALAARAHYIDISDDRASVRALSARRGEAERAGIAALPGLSTVPGLASALLEVARADLASVTGVRTAFFIGGGNRRGEGAARSALEQAGLAAPHLRAGRVRPVPALSARRPFPFPPPIGTFDALPIDVPDLDLLPARFPSLADLSVEVSFEDPLAARGLQALARARPFLPARAYALIERALVRVRGIGIGGSTRGAVAVLVRGRRASDGAPAKRAAAVWAAEEGQRLAALPAAVGAARLLAGGGARPGVHPLVGDWLSPRTFLEELEARGLHVTRSRS